MATAGVCELCSLLLYFGMSLTRSHIWNVSDSTLILLCFSIYNILTPDHPVQTVHLGDEDHSFGMSLTRPSISTALGEHAVSFDFGTVEEVFCKNRGSPLGMQSVQKEARAVWPVYCVKGNGDVVVAYTDLSPRYFLLSIIILDFCQDVTTFLGKLEIHKYYGNISFFVKISKLTTV